MSYWLEPFSVLVTFLLKDQPKKVLITDVPFCYQIPERDLVLGEMRALLKSLNAVFVGLAQNDQAFIVKSIEPVGMKMAADVNPVLMGKLPLEFKQVGMSVHKDFDVLREDISRGLSNQLITKRMSEITGKCIACHETYRLSP